MWKVTCLSLVLIRMWNKNKDKRRISAYLLILIIKKLKISIEHGKVVTTLVIIKQKTSYKVYLILEVPWEDLDLFYFITCEDPHEKKFIEIAVGWGPGHIWLHTTLESPWPHYMILEVCWDGLWSLPFGLSQSHGHGLMAVGSCVKCVLISSVFLHW